MNPVGSFFEKNYKAILVGIGIAFFGLFLSWMFQKIQNNNLLKKLKAELDRLLKKGESNLTAEEKEQMDYLKGEIYILKFQC